MSLIPQRDFLLGVKFHRGSPSRSLILLRESLLQEFNSAEGSPSRSLILLRESLLGVKFHRGSPF